MCFRPPPNFSCPRSIEKGEWVDQEEHTIHVPGAVLSRALHQREDFVPLLDGKQLIVPRIQLRPLALALGAKVILQARGKAGCSEIYVANPYEKKRPVNLPASTLCVREEWLLACAENYSLPTSNLFELGI